MRLDVTRVAAAVDRASGLTATMWVMSRMLFAPKRRRVGLAERLGNLSASLPVRTQVVMHWDDHQIPFIEAESDDDLAVALGAVHAHLRLGQMEMLRRLATGRVAEVAGPVAIELDRALRLFDFGRAVPEIISRLDNATLRWAEGFLRGVNHQTMNGPIPEEFRLFGIKPTPWTLLDLFTAARLAAADVTWLVWARLLRSRRRMSPQAWRALWPTLLGSGVEPSAGGPYAPLESVTRAGSNAAAVAGLRSKTGAALFAADPHLSIALPNIWLIAGFRSPGFNAVGLMPAGFPIIAIGRNPWIAWGGTSLHAASSELFDVGDDALRTRESTIPVRGARPRTVQLRESEQGPVISDGIILRDRKPLALRWMGHAPSDEMGAMLGVMRARSAEEFRAALADFSVPAQNMLHAGRDGRIGHLLAARLPRRKPSPPADLISPLADASDWDRQVATPDLPHWLDPQEGFVASANDRPPAGDVPVGFFFSPHDRVARMRALLSGSAPLDIDDMIALQLDVRVPSAPAARDALIARIPPSLRRRAVAQAIAGWDGSYAGDSVGALAYESLMCELARRLIPRARRQLLAGLWTGRAMIADMILAAPNAAFTVALGRGIRRTDRVLRRLRTWSGAHRVVLRHQLAALPVLGRRYQFGEMPGAGGNDTLNKTGHPMASGRHAVAYGASARFVADLSSPDANRAILLGGQDGWIGSDTFLDQAPLWRDGRYIDIPLRPETARAWPHHTLHQPLPSEPHA